MSATVNVVKAIAGEMTDDGLFGKELAKKVKDLGENSEKIFEECGELEKKIAKGNSAASLKFDKKYEELGEMLDRKDIAQKAGKVADVAGKAISIVTKCIELNGFRREFKNQDEFSLNAFTTYMETADCNMESVKQMKKALIDCCKDLSSSVYQYTFKQFLGVVDQWAMDAVSLSKVLSSPATAVLLAWNIGSNAIPMVSEALNDTAMFELAQYGSILQYDAFNNLYSNSFNEYTAEDLYARSQYAYVYLKACYITREAAIDSLIGTKGATGEYKHLAETSKRINEDIARIMVQLKRANKTNEGQAFGFLPSDNQVYLSQYDDSLLIDWIYLRNAVSDAYAENINGIQVSIPRVNLRGDTINALNEEIWNTLYEGVVVEEEERWRNSGNSYQYIKYDWSTTDGIISIIAENQTYDYNWWDYYVYNLDIHEKKVLSVEDMVAAAGLTEEEYYELVKTGLGAYLFETWEKHFKTHGHDDNFVQILERTISEENLRQCKPYFDENGRLCVIAGIHNMAGPEYNLYPIDLENPAGKEAYETYMRIMEEAEGSTDYRKQYEATLLRYPEYVTHVNVRYTDGKTIYTNWDTMYDIYDINKDGIPELIVNEDVDYYYVHSLVGTEVVEVGEFYNDYNDLYEYDGNGLNSHSGGSGTMRIEHLTVYSMDGTVLIEGEPEYYSGDSLMELHEKLDEMTPIEVKCPVRDYSLLGG